MKCIRPNCPNKAHPTKNLGLCSTHYGNVRKGFVDAAECKAHVHALRDMGYSMRRIGAESGLDTDTLTNLGEWNPGGRVRLSTHEKIMSIPLPAHMVSRGSQTIPNVGTKRRLQALTAAGYSTDCIAAEFGTTPTNVGYWFRRDHVRADTLERVRELFNRLQLVPGPSDRARRRARRLGWAPPLAWNESDIDSPDAVPDLGQEPSFIDIYKDARACGRSDEEIAARLGVKVATVKRKAQAQRRGERMGVAS